MINEGSQLAGQKIAMLLLCICMSSVELRTLRKAYIERHRSVL